MLSGVGQLSSLEAAVSSAQKRKREEAADDGSRLQFRPKTALSRGLPIAQPLGPSRLFPRGHLLTLREGRIVLTWDVRSPATLQELILGDYKEPSLDLVALQYGNDGIGE